jgi:hypothetical protein
MPEFTSGARVSVGAVSNVNSNGRMLTDLFPSMFCQGPTAGVVASTGDHRWAGAGNVAVYDLVLNGG